MESQMVHPHGHTHEQDLYKAQDPHLEGGEEEHHEKSSVLKKVKAKAKKIKETITKHGHGQNEHDHDIPGDHDLAEEEEEDDDESLEDPDVHGAPIYDSTDVRVSKTPVNTPLSSNSDHGASESVDPSKTVVPKTEPRKVNFERPRSGLLEDPQEPTAKHAPSNYQTKATDPTGKAGVDIGDSSPIISSFNKLNIDEKPRQNPIGTGSHDQFSPVNTPLSSFSDHGASETVDPSKTFVPKTEPREVNFERPRAEDPQGPNYQTKVTDPTGKAGEEIGDSSPIISSFNKLNIDKKPQQNPTGTGSHDQLSPVKECTAAPSYTAKISAATSAIADKAITAKNAVASKLGYSNPAGVAAGGDEKKPGTSPAPSYWAEKLKPAEDDRALSEAISGVFRQPEKGSRVTQSEEVTRRLGDDDGNDSKRVVEGEGEGEEGKVEYKKSGGGYYAEKIKETVGSMLGGLANTASHQSKPPPTDKSQGEGVGSVGGGA